MTNKNIFRKISAQINPKLKFLIKNCILKTAVALKPESGELWFSLFQIHYLMRWQLKLGESWVYYIDRAIEIDKDFFFEHRREVFNTFLRESNLSDMEKYMQKFGDLQAQFIKAHELDKLNIGIASPFLFSTYNASAYLDVYIKAMELGLTPRVKIYVLLPSNEKVSNPYMLQLWQKYIEVIRDDQTIRLFAKIRKYLQLDIDYTCSLSGKCMYIEHAKVIVQREWDARGLKPLLDLNLEDKECGWRQLAQQGIPKSSWFVALHVRDSGYRLGSFDGENDPNSYRNADINTYLTAIREIVKRGGFVVRVGDPAMKPVAPMAGLFDYARSSIRSNKMDIFLFSQCRFFIATNSGPLLVPCVFGVPTIITNLLPMTQRPWKDNNLFLPKLLWLKDKKRNATLEEVLSSKAGHFYSSRLYDEANIQILDNSPEELSDAVVEMLDYLEGVLEYQVKDDQYQSEINFLYEKYSRYGTNGRMGRAFLQRYKEVLMPTRCNS